MPVASFTADVHVSGSQIQTESSSGCFVNQEQRMRVFILRLLLRDPALAVTAAIRLTFHLLLSFKTIVPVLKIALAKICPGSFECYLVE